MLIVTSNLNKSSTNWINYLSQRGPWRNKVVCRRLSATLGMLIFVMIR